MKRLFTFLPALVLLFSSIVVFAQVVLKFENENYDFGKIELYRQVNAKIKVKNTGKNPLEITGVKSACNCIQIINLPEPLKSNQETTLELSYNPNMLDIRNEVVEFNSNDIVSENQ